MNYVEIAHAKPLHCLRLNPQGGEASVLPVLQQVFPRLGDMWFKDVQSHGASWCQLYHVISEIFVTEIKTTSYIILPQSVLIRVNILHQSSENASPPGLGWHNRCSLPHRSSCSERQCQHIHHFLSQSADSFTHLTHLTVTIRNQCKCAQRKCCDKRNWVKP